MLQTNERTNGRTNRTEFIGPSPINRGSKNQYTSSTNGFTHETMFNLSSYIHRPHILSLKGAKMRLGVGSKSPKGVKIENMSEGVRSDSFGNTISPSLINAETEQQENHQTILDIPSSKSQRMKNKDNPFIVI